MQEVQKKSSTDALIVAISTPKHLSSPSQTFQEIENKLEMKMHGQSPACWKHRGFSAFLPIYLNITTVPAWARLKNIKGGKWSYREENSVLETHYSVEMYPEEGRNVIVSSYIIEDFPTEEETTTKEYKGMVKGRKFKILSAYPRLKARTLEEKQYK